MAHQESLSHAEIARSGARHLAGLVQRNGRFTYRYASSNGQPMGGYNLLRHSGAIWSLAQTARILGDLDDVTDAARGALSWLLSKRVVRVRDALCVAGKRGAKLGGAALAILACLEVNRIHADPELVRVARGLGRFLVLLRRDDGDFDHKIDLNDGEVSPFRSDYYTGEALFALAQLHEATGEDAWLDLALDSIMALDARDYGVAEQSHWMLYALDAVFRHRHEPECLIYAEKIVRNILDVPDYREAGRSTPIACRTEGFLAFMRMTAASGSSTHRSLAASALDAIVTNLGMQARFRHSSGAFVRGVNCDEVRIDYIQHNISSFLMHHCLSQ